MDKYKVWIHVEELEENKQFYRSTGLPIELGSFTDLKLVCKFAPFLTLLVDRLCDLANNTQEE